MKPWHPIFKLNTWLLLDYLIFVYHFNFSWTALQIFWIIRMINRNGCTTIPRNMALVYSSRLLRKCTIWNLVNFILFNFSSVFLFYLLRNFKTTSMRHISHLAKASLYFFLNYKILLFVFYLLHNLDKKNHLTSKKQIV